MAVCPTCGGFVPGNNPVCGFCTPPKPGPGTSTMVRKYESPQQYATDSARLALAGWTVANVAEHRPRQGCGRILLMGFVFAFMFPPAPEIIVTYTSKPKMVRRRRRVIDDDEDE